MGQCSHDEDDQKGLGGGHTLVQGIPATEDDKHRCERRKIGNRLRTAQPTPATLLPGDCEARRSVAVCVADPSTKRRYRGDTRLLLRRENTDFERSK